MWALLRKKPPSLNVLHHEVSTARLQAPFDGLRVGHLSDIHVRTGKTPHRLHQAVEWLNRMKPDFVALTGDYICYSTRPLPALTEALKSLRVPALATLGNHDHWQDARKVRRALEAAGVDVLANEHRALKVRGEPLSVVGVDDPVTKKANPQRAFAGLHGQPGAVVLSHCPTPAEMLSHFEPALILSGHTHGGQMYFERFTPWLFEKAGIRYLSGFFDVRGTCLYVSRGLGESLPFRFRAPAEATIFTLRSR